MANIEVHPPARGDVESDTQKRIQIKRNTGMGGLAVETLAAVAAVVLAIIGLAGLFPMNLAGVTAIAVGCALLFAGLTIGTQLHPSSPEFIEQHDPAVGGIGVEALAGLAGITLGIISLADVASFFLLPITAIVVGGGLIFAAQPFVEVAREERRAEYAWRPKSEILYGSSLSASGAHAFAGVAAVVLGILGVIMPSLVSLSLVAFLVVGATLLLGSAAIGGRLAGYLRR